MAEQKISCNVKFNYDRYVPKWLRGSVESEYMRLRNIACDALNPHYEEWNKEFDFDAHADDIPDNDELKDFGGTEYCNFINERQTPILEEVNRRHARGVVKLYPTKECDIGGIALTPFVKKEVARFYITINPIQ